MNEDAEKISASSADKISVTDFNQYTRSVDDMLNVIQLIIDEEQQRNIVQDDLICKIQEQLTILSKQVEELAASVEKFKEHMDNGWRQEFIDMFSEQTKYMSKELQNMQFEQSRQQNSVVIDEMKAVYNSFLQLNEKKKDKHTIDWNQLILGQFGTGGIIYLIVEIITRFIK